VHIPLYTKHFVLGLIICFWEYTNRNIQNISKKQSPILISEAKNVVEFVTNFLDAFINNTSCNFEVIRNSSINIVFKNKKNQISL